MASFSQDKKWAEAKRAVGSNGSWIEIVSYYRSIGGKHAFVYSILEGEKRLIVDLIDDENVLLINRQGEPILNSYNIVFNSRKVFKHSEDHIEKTYYINSRQYNVILERYK